MMNYKNKQWRLKRYPEGMPQLDNWELVESPVPEIGEGEFLVRSIYLSVDPYMRGRISPKENYAKGVQLGDLMVGGGVGQVIQSRNPDFSEGDYVVSDMSFGWQEFVVFDGSESRRFEKDVTPLHAELSYLGIPGLTAYMVLLEATGLKAGETLVVSAASGAVGQVAGQIARLLGARAIAVASSDEKLAWCRELGYDEVINYRTCTDLDAAFKRAAPQGVNVFLDNTAGPIHHAVMKNLAEKARVSIVGTVAVADRFDEEDIGPTNLRRILVKRARVEGFLLFDFVEKFPEARKAIIDWFKEGKIKYREDVMEGIESMPEAFIRMLEGRNFGKQLVKL